MAALLFNHGDKGEDTELHGEFLSKLHASLGQPHPNPLQRRGLKNNTHDSTFSSGEGRDEASAKVTCATV
jgi:hypothetical protein